MMSKPYLKFSILNQLDHEDLEIFILNHGRNAIKIVVLALAQMKINALIVLNNCYQEIMFLQVDAALNIGNFYFY